MNQLLKSFRAFATVARRLNDGKNQDVIEMHPTEEGVYVPARKEKKLAKLDEIERIIGEIEKVSRIKKWPIR